MSCLRDENRGRHSSNSPRRVFAVTLLATATSVWAQAAGDPESAVGKLTPAPGLKVELFAAEPQVVNPVSFCIDRQGRFYVAESFRIKAGVIDIRWYADWIDDDLACRTVADRVAMFRRLFGDRVIQDTAVAADRIRRIEDRDGDGRADHAVVFADGFDGIAAGIGAGLLARGDTLWYTNIPHLWQLKDTNDDGVADVRQSLHEGYGVHVAFYGHDLHGLRFGPDGKLYFSIGDRGFHVETQSETFANPDTGAVLRCNPDGSDLEVIATGLRNPQELAFDQYGNLWTGDNNSDAGDRARLVYVVEGGDSGWRIHYQTLPDRGPWNREGLWHLGDPAKSQVPPIAHIGRGPAGLTFNPGTGLPARYDHHFLMCDYPGGVNSFAVKPDGAGFKMVDLQRFLWNLWPTDVDFGPDGAVYVSDWVYGWEQTSMGRIFRVTSPETQREPIVAETKRLINTGMANRTQAERVRLLEHRDQRVRQAAQFALAATGADAIEPLTAVARNSAHELARLHAIWALGQIATTHRPALDPLLGLLDDPHAEVRAQATGILGNHREQRAYRSLLARLRDDSARVRFFAAMSLGKLGQRDAITPILNLLRDNNDRDAYLRHAGVMALTAIGDIEALVTAGRDESDAVRLAALLALRRLERPEVVMFLSDRRPTLRLEAARAIHDVPINAARPALAARIAESNVAEPILRRVLAANLGERTTTTAAALARFATRDDVPADYRAMALTFLGQWARPPQRDPVTGAWRPLPASDPEPARLALRTMGLTVLESAPTPIQVEAVRAIARLGMRDTGRRLFAIAQDRNAAPAVRAEAIRALDVLHDPNLSAAVRTALAEPSSLVSAVGVELIDKIGGNDAAERLERILLSDGSLRVRQRAAQTLGRLRDLRADSVLVRCMDQLLAGSLPSGLHLDVLEAASQRKSPELSAKVEAHDRARPADDPLGAYRESVYGGDPAVGAKIFLEKQAAQCLKCHAINGEGGIVGPDLESVGAQRKREELLESIVLPNAKIAEGYDRLMVLAEGHTYYGRLLREDAARLTLLNDEGYEMTLVKTEIEGRQSARSAMPENVNEFLTKRELRDLVAFLATLQSRQENAAP